MSLSFLFFCTMTKTSTHRCLLSQRKILIFFLSFFAQIHIFWCERMEVRKRRRERQERRGNVSFIISQSSPFLNTLTMEFPFSLFLHLFISFFFLKRRLFFICYSYGNLSSQCVRCKLLMMIPSAYDNGKNEILFLFMA